jgi:pyruvate/2-oxoglutarate dehydrogenase complex dihydrolipoamide acyltransferase (E2) component
MKEIFITKGSPEMEEGMVSEWQKEEGEEVSTDEVIVEVETDKAVVSIEAEISGFLHIIVKDGEFASLTQPIGIIFESKEEYQKHVKDK